MNQFENTLNQLSTAVLVFDGEGRCNSANIASQALLQIGSRALIGKSIADIFPTNEQIIDQCKSAVNEERDITLREVEVYLPQWGIGLLIDVIATPFGFSQPNGVEGNEIEQGLVLELLDRKDVSELAHDTDSANRFNTATQIVRGLCHEIKNPLGGIRGAAQLLSLETENVEISEYAQVITREVDRLSNLLDRMSTLGQANKAEPTDIHELIMQQCGLLTAEFKDVTFEIDFDTSLPRIESKTQQLEQALLNVLKNAVQWSTSSKENSAVVCVKTRAAYPNPRRMLMPEKGVQIQVIDNGPGVSADIIEQLFMPMVSRREGGTGLGLSLSQQIAHGHGGFIQYDKSYADNGASFSIFLPYSNE